MIEHSPKTNAKTTPHGAVVAGPGAAVAQNVEIMRAHHERILRLCDELEAIADSLPERVDVRECLKVARALAPTVRAAHSFEEETFFPLARAVAGGGRARFEENVRRLLGEHQEDESFAEEAAEALLDWGLCTDRRGSEITGYMLRGLFETLRRHVAFEREYLIAPVEATLAT
ncbi:MAG: hemerythrin domain-containing protein [Marivibrio sp.]|uniref:hemerythrin domain-containing protein n=1 Tax=Marivibrio sp. TaxID=2039719 RepID=UPI0032EC29BD